MSSYRSIFMCFIPGSELETGIQNGNHEYKTMFPIAIPLGLNHISYIEGPMPDHVVDYNIVAEATDEEGRATVNYYTDSFFTYWVRKRDYTTLFSNSIKSSLHNISLKIGLLLSYL